MQYRKQALETGEFYHIYTRSIAKYEIFQNESDYHRLKKLLSLCRLKEFKYKYSFFNRLIPSTQDRILKTISGELKLVQIISYCIMPTHLHLILKQNEKDGISKYMSRVLNCYSRYFNSKYSRTGPLWSGRFKNNLVNTTEQLLHLTRYVHLNPCSANIVNKPEDWGHSSYCEYVEAEPDRICDYSGLFEIDPENYREFVCDRISFQRELSKIKKILIEGYSG